METFILFVVVWAISALVGSFIDAKRGALWGLFLGPIGWIIAAILKSKLDKQPSVVRSVETFSPSSSSRFSEPRKSAIIESDEQRRWKVLKEVDLEIRAASEQVIKLDPSLDAVLAEKYLVLNDKQYLQRLTELVVRSHKEEKSALQARAAQLSEGVFQSGRQQKIDYERSLGAGSIDPKTGMKVKSVEIYDGSWLGWKGGIRITLDNGTNILVDKSMRREFAAGDESWM